MSSWYWLPPHWWHSRWPSFARSSAGRPDMTLMDVAAAVIVVALLAYLVYALLAPERLG
jgi:K+-transporting ATPase KdpF subunit